MGRRIGAKCTAIVLDAHVYMGVNQVGGNLYGLLGVDEDILVIFWVVRGACSDSQHVLLVVGDFWHFRLG
jgi:hypothetical protein